MSDLPRVRIESRCVNEKDNLQIGQNKIMIDGVDISNCVTEVYIHITGNALPKVSLTVIPAQLDIESSIIEEIRTQLIEENRA